jgi:nitrate reductase molybdenum cofactor assembly chaperone NarJ/NarW
MVNERLLELMSRILSYPDEQYPEAVATWQQEVAQVCPGSVDHASRFAASLVGQGTEELQEMYVRTFDLNPVCALEVGWQLFGDTYDRGEFLVTMRQELRRHGIAELHELPDHLSHLLLLLGKMAPELAPTFASTCLLLAMKKMLVGFEGKGNPYEEFLRATTSVIEAAQPLALAEVVHG